MNSMPTMYRNSGQGQGDPQAEGADQAQTKKLQQSMKFPSSQNPVLSTPPPGNQLASPAVMPPTNSQGGMGSQMQNMMGLQDTQAGFGGMGPQMQNMMGRMGGPGGGMAGGGPTMSGALGPDSIARLQSRMGGMGGGMGPQMQNLMGQIGATHQGGGMGQNPYSQMNPFMRQMMGGQGGFGGMGHQMMQDHYSQFGAQMNPFMRQMQGGFGGMGQNPFMAMGNRMGQMQGDVGMGGFGGYGGMEQLAAQMDGRGGFGGQMPMGGPQSPFANGNPFFNRNGGLRKAWRQGAQGPEAEPTWFMNRA